MLNSYNNTTQKINVNAVSGTIVKNYKESFFLRFEKKSNYEKSLFSAEPTLLLAVDGKYGKRAENVPVVVIQVMILNDNNYLAEVIRKDDFEKDFQCVKESDEE